MAASVDFKPRQTAMVPVTTMEELPILSESERAEMLASLLAAEARIAQGEFVTHRSETFVDDMMAIRAAALAARKA